MVISTDLTILRDPQPWVFEAFPQTLLDGAGQAVLTLRRAPKANQVIVVSAAGVPRVVSVSGRNVTIGVRDQTTPIFVHSPTFETNALRATGAVANVTADDVTAGGTCTDPVAGVCGGQNHINVITPRADLVQAATASKFSAVITIPAHGLANLPDSVGATVDLGVHYVPA